MHSCLPLASAGTPSIEPGSAGAPVAHAAFTSRRRRLPETQIVLERRELKHQHDRGHRISGAPWNAVQSHCEQNREPDRRQIQDPRSRQRRTIRPAATAPGSCEIRIAAAASHSIRAGCDRTASHRIAAI